MKKKFRYSDKQIMKWGLAFMTPFVGVLIYTYFLKKAWRRRT